MSLTGGFGTLIWMKKPVILVSSIVFLLATFLIVFASNNGFRNCEFERDKVCFDDELKQYAIEENAILTFEVSSPEYGEAIKNLWSKVHPEANAISYVLRGEQVYSDLIYLTQNDAAIKYDSLYLLDKNTINNTPLISTELNLEGIKYLPLVGEGFAFITNKTELQTLGYSWLDSNSNNLHDSFESYESIINAQANWQTDKRKLVLSLSEPFTLFPLFTSNGWKLFEEYTSYYPGFENETFLDALKFIKVLSSVNWNQTETNDAANYTWDYPNVLFDDNFIFSQVSSWMYFEEMDLKHASEWVIASFPKASAESAQSLHPMLTEIEGYSVNINTAYPSAAHELMRLIYSNEGLQTKIDSDKVIVLTNKESLDGLNFRNNYLKQFAYAFLESQSEPLVAVEDYPNQLAIRLYYDIDIESTIQRLWNNEITPEEAQIEIVLKADQWIIENTKLFEGKINHE